MSNISAWSTSATNNNSAPPDGWPEGMAPSAVNDAARENMAAIRRWYNDAEWINWGDVLARQSNNSFLVSRTATDVYTSSRRLKLYQAGITLNAKVLFSSPSGINTLVTVSSTTPLSTSLSSGAVGILNPFFNSVPTTPVANNPGTAKAWGVFNGTTSVSGIASYNVKSIVRLSLGHYQISLSSSIVVGSYSVIVTCGNNGQQFGHLDTFIPITVDGFLITTRLSNTASVADSDIVSFAIFGNSP